MSPNRRSSLALPAILVLLSATTPFVAQRLTQALDIETGPDASRTLGYLSGVGLWLSVALLLDRLLAALVWNRLASRRDEVGAPHLLIDLVRLSIYSLAVTIIVGYVFGLSLTGFWATSGVVGLVLGFAVRNLILDLFTGIAVNVEQPYREGDWLEAQIPGAPKVGRVIGMNWRTTRLATEDGDIVVIPNGMLATLVVTNRGGHHRRMRSETRVNLDFSIPVERARRILQAAAIQSVDHPGFCTEPAPQVLVAGVGDRGVEYIVRYWHTVWKELSPTAARDVVVSAIHEHLRQAGLVPAHAKEDLYVASLPAHQLDVMSDGDREELLSRVEIFRALAPEELRAVATGMNRVLLHAGSDLLRAGDVGDSMYIIVEGVLDVLVPGTGEEGLRKVSRMGPGEVIGEMSLLTGEPRSATIRAVTDTVAYQVTREPITALFDRRPEVAERISEVVARRLAERQERLASEAGVSSPGTGVTAGQLLSRIRAIFRSTNP